MKNIGICANENKDIGLETTNKIIKYIKKWNSNAEVFDSTHNYDLIISVGGDGTFLGTARRVIGKDIPIVGVNSGNLGYLSSIEKNNLEESLLQILNDEYSIEERNLIKAECNEQTIYALNDVVVSRGSYEKMIDIKLSLDKKYIDDYYCDGIIIATPTGSTAYSLSAGGPITEPSIDALIITPVCPHSLNQRPIIVSSNRVININSEHNQFMVATDGQQTIKDAKNVTIRQSNNKIKILRLKDDFFFDTVRNKLMK